MSHLMIDSLTFSLVCVFQGLAYHAQIGHTRI
jgi:hypothetical protein